MRYVRSSSHVYGGKTLLSTWSTIGSVWNRFHWADCTSMIIVISVCECAIQLCGRANNEVRQKSVNESTMLSIMLIWTTKINDRSSQITTSHFGRELTMRVKLYQTFCSYSFEWRSSFVSGFKYPQFPIGKQKTETKKEKKKKRCELAYKL